MQYVLRTQGLTKHFKHHAAVNGLSMNVQKGDVYGFVGENGSGKTTVIRIISGLIFADGGGFELFGVDGGSKDIGQARKRMGAIVESPSVYLNMTAYDCLSMQCTILGIGTQGIESALEEVGLSYLLKDKKKVGDFSLGMRQRLGIAMALLGEPELLILDEPMNGLDPAGIVDIRELILRLNREKGITFIISSHILTELALVATRYGIISRGKILKEISAEQLSKECEHTVIVRSDDDGALLGLALSLGLDASLADEGCIIRGEVSLNDLLEGIIRQGIKIESINCNQTSIEQYYLSVTGGRK